MDREWFTVSLLQSNIAVLVVIVLVGITFITSRLALDPSESLGRWLQDRGRTAVPGARQPDSPLLTEATEPADAARQAKESLLHTPEWLDRLIGNHRQDEVRPAGKVQVQQEPGIGRRVA